MTRRSASWLVAATSLTLGTAAAQTAAPAGAPAASASAPAPSAGRQRPVAPPGRWTRAQVDQAYALADEDENGELTRAEAQRLPLLPGSFEEADQNKDGVLARDEYRAAFPP